MTTEWWWAYWSNIELEKAISGGVDGPAKFLLWKYENYLESLCKPGYTPMRYDKIIKPELEHIAPSSEPDEKAHGYDIYDEEFKNQYLNCLGNFLLLSKSHNCAVGKISFPSKLATYTVLAQHREIKDLVVNSGIWDRVVIGQRKAKIIRFVVDNL